MLGVWAFTNLEFAYAMLRVDERLRAVRDGDARQRRPDDRVLARARGRPAPQLQRPAARQLRRVGGRADRAVVDDARAALPPPPRRRDAPSAAALRAADRSRRGVRVRAQRPGPAVHRARARSERGRSVLARGQDRGRGRVRRARIPIRVAAPGLLDHRRRRGSSLLRVGHDLLRAAERLDRRRSHARGALDRAPALDPDSSSMPTARFRGCRSAGRCTACGSCSS